MHRLDLRRDGHLDRDHGDGAVAVDSQLGEVGEEDAGRVAGDVGRDEIAGRLAGVCGVVDDVRRSDRRLQELQRAPRLGGQERSRARGTPRGAYAGHRSASYEGERMEWTFLLIGLAVAVAVAAVCYRIAEGKGRSGPLWAVLGFFFPVIALVIVFVLPDRRGA
jgi:hypothetical protein